mgnify:CR=1 FL=1
MWSVAYRCLLNGALLTGAHAANMGETWLVKGMEYDEKHPGQTDAVTPTEIAWTQMSGRCCFDGEWVGPLGSKTWVQGAETCGACTEWGKVTASCHSSRKECMGCGVPLYCDAPPPIVGFGKECIGASRVGTGCQDSVSTGICMTKGVDDCHAECKVTAGCQIFISWIKERRGECVLCSDLKETRPTPGVTTRAYKADKTCATIGRHLLHTHTPTHPPTTTPTIPPSPPPVFPPPLSALCISFAHTALDYPR